MPPVARAVDGAPRIRQRLDAGLDSLDAALTALDTSRSPAVLHAAFRRARTEYKRLETLIAFYSPTTAIALNAPIGDEESDEAVTGKTGPQGFQALEPSLFPAIDRTRLDTVHAVAAAMRKDVKGFRNYTSLVRPTAPQLFEAARLELARVSTLGIVGFDASASGDALVESADALDGLRETLRDGLGDHADRLVPSLVAAATYLRTHSDFDTFDRFDFIVRYANPAFAALGDLGRTLSDPPLELRRVWPVTVNSVYDVRRFNAMAYAPDEGRPPTPELVSLGKTLFFDPVMSGNGTRSCASCHVPEHAFTDGRVRALEFVPSVHPGSPPATRHTPSLINAAFQPVLFADERAASLERQIAIVLASPAEMHSAIDTAVRRLRANATYRTLFARALGGMPDTAVSPRTLRIALAAYVRSLNGLNSPFDRAVRGDSNAHLSTAERRGFNVFMGKARCGTCHFAPMFNGTAPPQYASDESEVIGVLAKPTSRGGVLDPDSGRGSIDHLSGAHACVQDANRSQCGADGAVHAQRRLSYPCLRARLLQSRRRGRSGNFATESNA